MMCNLDQGVLRLQGTLTMQHRFMDADQESLPGSQWPDVMLEIIITMKLVARFCLWS